MGDRGRVRELWERGERTEFSFVVFDAVRCGTVGLARLLFFMTGRVSGPPILWFSLSDVICMSELLRFLVRIGDVCG
jgi:hypothetical protein